MKKFEALVVGVASYPGLKTTKLESPRHGATGIAEVLEENKELYRVNYLGFDECGFRGVVFDNKLKMGLERLFGERQEPPKLALFYFCGHGGPDQDSEKYLLTSDATEEAPRGVLIHDLFDILKNSPVKNQVIWLDCCFSGELISYFTENDNELEDEGIHRFILASSRKSEVSHAEPGKPAELTETILNRLKEGYTTFLSNEEIEAYIKDNPPKQQEFIIYNTPEKPPMAILRKGYRATLEELENKNPYPGFKSFDEKNAPFFFGRENLVEEMLQKIEDHSFIVLTGSSGTGKSSLLYAGVYDAIKQGQIIPRSNSKWDYCLPFTPLEKDIEPLAEFQKNLEIFSGNDGQNNTLSSEEFVNKVSTLITKNSIKEKVIITIDQFEQIFRQQNQNKDLYLSLIKKVIKEKNSHICIVVGIRSDFLSTLEEELKEDFKIKGTPVLNLNYCKLESKDIGNIITQPIACLEPSKVNVIEEDLQETLIKKFDWEEGTANLPTLQYILNSLWEPYNNKKINKISLEFYQDTCEAKIKKFLSELTEEIYNNKIPSHKKNVALRLVMELYYKNRKKIEKIKIKELENYDHEEDIFKEICEIFVQARLMTIGRDSDNDVYCSISHPLIAESWEEYWKELREWIKEYPEEASIIEHKLERYAKIWQNDKKRSNLIGGKELKEAKNYLNDYPEWIMMLDGETIDFIRRSEKKEDTQNSIIGMAITGGIVFLLLLATGLVVKTIQAATEAEQISFILRGFDRTIGELRRAILIGKKVINDSPSLDSPVPYSRFLDDIKKIKIVRNLRHSIAENNLDWFEETNIRLNGYDLPDGKWIKDIDTTTIDLNEDGKETTYIAAAGYNNVNLVRILPNNEKELCSPLPHFSQDELKNYQAKYKGFVPWVNQVSLSAFNGNNLLLITVGYNSIKITNLTQDIINKICDLQAKSEKNIDKIVQNHNVDKDIDPKQEIINIVQNYTVTVTVDEEIDLKQEIINDDHLWINSVDVSNDDALTDKIIATAGYGQLNLWKVTIEGNTPIIIPLKSRKIIGDETIPEEDSRRWINQVVISPDKEKDNQIIATGGYKIVSLWTREGDYIGKLDHRCDRIIDLFKSRYPQDCESEPDEWVNSISIISKPKGNENIIATAISSYGIFFWSKSDRCLLKSNLNREEDYCIVAVLPYATWNPPKYVNVVKLFKDKDEKKEDVIWLAAGGSDKMLRIWGLKIDKEKESQPIDRINLEQIIFYGSNINSLDSFDNNDNKHLAISSKNSLILKILKPQVLPFSTFAYENPIEDLKLINYSSKNFLFTRHSSQQEKVLLFRSAKIVPSSEEPKKINFEKPKKKTNLSSFDSNGNTLVVKADKKNDGEINYSISIFEPELDKNNDISLIEKDEHRDLKDSIVSQLNDGSNECKFSIKRTLFISDNHLQENVKLLFHIIGEENTNEGNNVCKNNQLIFWDRSEQQPKEINLPLPEKIKKINSISSFTTNSGDKTYVVVAANESKDIIAFVANNFKKNENTFKKPYYLFPSNQDEDNESKVVKFIEFSPTGKRFATVETVTINEKLENIVRLWEFDPESNSRDEPIKEVEDLSLPLTKEKEIITLKFGQKQNDNSYPLLIATTNQLYLWMFDEEKNKLRKLKQSIELPRRITQADFVPKDNLIAIANANIMTLWNFDFKLHDILTNTADIKKFVFSTDGKYVASSTEGNQVTFWEIGEKFDNLDKFLKFGCRWIKSNLEINKNLIHTNSFEHPELPEEEIKFCEKLLDLEDKEEKN